MSDEQVVIETTEGWQRRENRMSPPTLQSRLPATLRLVNTTAQMLRAKLEFTFKQWLRLDEVRQRYQQEVAYADREIGRLLEGLDQRGLLDNTLIIFTSDHGEGLGNHNHVGHISQVYDSLIRIPLIISFPGILPAGPRVDDIVSLIDVYPTVAEMLGLDPPSPASGASFAGRMRGEPGAHRPVIAVTYRPEAFTDKRAILKDGFKYIHSWSDERDWEELYDLVADPGELVDLIELRPDVVDGLRQALETRLAAGPRTPSLDAELSEEDAARMRALGYLK
jgi:arylsulfatase A-like enzyme